MVLKISCVRGRFIPGFVELILLMMAPRYDLLALICLGNRRKRNSGLLVTLLFRTFKNGNFEKKKVFC